MTKKQNDPQNNKSQPPPEEGLIGLFGHTYVLTEDVPDRKTIEYQFKIIRELSGARYVVQLFSFADGRPTELAVYDESFLLSKDVKLYATEDIWNNECEVESRRDHDARIRAEHKLKLIPPGA